MPTRVSWPTTLARGKLLFQSPLETFPDLSLDLRLPVSGEISTELQLQLFFKNLDNFSIK